jgi:hypothetical protein
MRDGLLLLRKPFELNHAFDDLSNVSGSAQVSYRPNCGPVELGYRGGMVREVTSAVIFSDAIEQPGEDRGSDERGSELAASPAIA